MARRRRRKSEMGRVGRVTLEIAFALVAASVALVAPWRFIAPPTSAFMLRERLAPDGAGADLRYRWLPLEQISPQLAICVVAAEDQKFPTHSGFDFDSIASAVREPGSRGASTISQQVAKNLFLWPGKSYLRKGLEAWLTLWIELLWPKRRILEVYLNVAEFAPGVFGADAASERLFGKPARALGLEQAALLAAVLPNPQRLNAADPSDYLYQRAREIQQAVRSLGGAGYLAGL